MARGSRLAAGAREEHEVLPALGRSGKHGERRWDPEHNRTRSGEGGSIHLRSKRRGTDSGRAAVLRTFPPSRAGTARSEQGGITQRRADLYDASVREGPGGHRACFAGLVCEQLGGGYGFYGEAGRRHRRWCCRWFRSASDKVNRAGGIPHLIARTKFSILGTSP